MLYLNGGVLIYMYKQSNTVYLLIIFTLMNKIYDIDSSLIDQNLQ